MIIAERTFSIVNEAAGKQTKVTIRLLQPVPDEGGPDYRCPWEIEVDGQATARFACGIDGFQAIQCALQILASEVKRLKANLGGYVVWLDEKVDDDGLDLPPSIF
jgi:hypothetical protein